MPRKDKLKHDVDAPSMEDTEKTVAETAPEANVTAELRAAIDRLQRLQAEFENYKKRTLRAAETLEERVSDRVILEFLPLFDNLQRAFQSMSSNHDMDTFVAGIEQIFAQFQQVLETAGVTPIEAVDEPFDPERHEAMLSVPGDAAKNIIIEEFMPGYLRNDRVLRASKVSVSQGPVRHEEDSE